MSLLGWVRILGATGRELNRNDCLRCGYSWIPRGRSYSIRCPNCGAHRAPTQNGTNHSPSPPAINFLIVLGVLGAAFFGVLFLGLLAKNGERAQLHDVRYPVQDSPIEQIDSLTETEPELVPEDIQPEVVLTEETPFEEQPEPEPLFEQGSVIEGKIVRVHHGDKFTAMLKDHSRVTIQLAGIEAPENHQPHYREARNALSKMCLGERINLLYW